MPPWSSYSNSELPSMQIQVFRQFIKLYILVVWSVLKVIQHICRIYTECENHNCILIYLRRTNGPKYNTMYIFHRNLYSEMSAFPSFPLEYKTVVLNL